MSSTINVQPFILIEKIFNLTVDYFLMLGKQRADSKTKYLF